ncbi:MAG: hypothetical protein AAB350_00015 [Patescibacteria group bacterium]
MSRKIFKKIIIAIPILIITFVMVFNYEPTEIKALTVTGSPSAGAGVGDSGTSCNNADGDWANPTFAASSNNSYTDFGGNFFDANEISDELQVSNLGLALPAGSTIDGITVEIEKYAGGGDLAVDYDVRLTKTAGVQIGTNKTDTATNWATADPNSYVSYGGATDKWGTTWTEAEVETTGFGLVFCGKSNNDANVNLYIDHIQITVYYTPAISVDLSGTVYQSSGGSNIGASKTITVYKNGSTSLGSDTTDINGAWALTGLNISSGDIINVYIDGDATYKGNTVFVSDGNNQTNVDIYGSTLIVRHDTGSNITNTNLSTARVGTDANDMVYSVSGTNLTATTSAEIHVWTGDTFAPDGFIKTNGAVSNLHIDDNASVSLSTTDNIINGNITINTGATLTISADTKLGGNLTNNGTFTHSANTLEFINSATPSTILSATDISFSTLKSSAAGKIIKFQKQIAGSPKFTITGQFNFQGLAGNPINISSDTSGTEWHIHLNSSQSSVSNIRVTDSACAVGTNSISANASIIDGGNNGSCWGIINVNAPPAVGESPGGGGGTLKTGGGRGGQQPSGATADGGGDLETGGTVAPPTVISP